MKRQIKRSAIMMMVLAVVACVAPSNRFWSAEAAAEVNVTVNIGAPPPVIVRARPTMVYLQEPAAYVAVGIPYDIYFVSGHYYYLHGNDWFWASAYNGPWVYVSYRTLPPGLRKFKVERLHEFREREYRVYEVQGPSFKGKHFEAVEYREPSKPGHGNDDKGHDDKGHGNGNSSHGNKK